jgi:hypothetical protein
MDKHVSNLCRRAFYRIRRIALIRKYLDHDSTARFISVFVLSLLDNGNSLLVGLTEKQLKLNPHIKQQLKTIHWLPVRPPHRFQNRYISLPFCARPSSLLSG